MEYSFLAATLLFQGTSTEEIEKMLDCLGAEQKHYKKGELVYHTGDIVQSMGMVLSGSVNIENDDLWGNKSILNHISAGQIFAETYACIPEEPLMVSVAAAEDTKVLFLNTGRLLQTCSDTCACHSKLIRNLLAVTAQKNLNLSARILHTTSKSIRGRLMSYLGHEAKRQGSLELVIPFNRQQLADYLGVDRSAMSNELGKMQREGLLRTEKSHFYLQDS